MLQSTQSILTTDGPLPISGVTRSTQVQTLQQDGFVPVAVASHPVMDGSSEMIECAWEGDREPSNLHPANRLITCWSAEPRQYVVSLVQCAEDGYALTVLEGLPKNINEAPIHSGKTLYRTWNWQKFWFLKGFARRELAWFELNRLSLEHSLPILDLRQFAELDGGFDLFCELMQTADTSRFSTTLQETFSVSSSPDFLAISQLKNEDPVCGFVINGYPDRTQKVGSRLFLVPTNMTLPASEVTYVHRDLIMVKEYFSSQSMAMEWLRSRMPSQDLMILSRNFYLQSSCRYLAANRLTPGMMTLNLSGRQVPEFRRLVHVKPVQGKAHQAVVDIRLKQAGVAFVNGIGMAIEGGK